MGKSSSRVACGHFTLRFSLCAPGKRHKLALVGSKFRMKPITILFVALLAVAGFGVGVVVGQHRANAALTNSKSASDAASRSGSPTSLPALTSRPKRPAQPADTEEKPAKRLSLAEVETALGELKLLSRE